VRELCSPCKQTPLRSLLKEKMERLPGGGSPDRTMINKIMSKENDFVTPSSMQNKGIHGDADKAKEDGLVEERERIRARR